MKRHKYRHMKGHRFELKTVHFVPTHAEHEKAEGREYERMEHKMGHPVKGNPKPEPFVRNQYEEKVKELEKTNRVTGLWYPHKSK